MIYLIFKIEKLINLFNYHYFWVNTQSCPFGFLPVLNGALLSIPELQSRQTIKLNKIKLDFTPHTVIKCSSNPGIFIWFLRNGMQSQCCTTLLNSKLISSRFHQSSALGCVVWDAIYNCASTMRGNLDVCKVYAVRGRWCGSQCISSVMIHFVLWLRTVNLMFYEFASFVVITWLSENEKQQTRQLP